MNIFKFLMRIKIQFIEYIFYINQSSLLYLIKLKNRCSKEKKLLMNKF